MSQAIEAPATPESKPSAETTAPSQSDTSSKGGDFLSFADALDAGFEAFSKPSAPVETEKAQAVPESKEVVSEPAAKESSVSNPLDVITKRLTGKETDQPVSSTQQEDSEVKAPENLKPEAQTAWAKLTKDLKEARGKIKELESKVSEAVPASQEQNSLKAELDALRSEKEEYESELRVARLESTKEYKQTVTEPLQVIQKEVMEIAQVYETDPRNIYAAMAEEDPVKRRQFLKELTSNFDPVDSLAIRNKAEELHRVFEKRELLHKDVKTVLDVIENERKQEEETRLKHMQQQISDAYKSEWEAIQKENPLLRPVQDNETWNNTLRAIEKQALDIENTELEPRAKARLTFNAAAMPVVMNLFQDYVVKTQGRISELEKLTKELRATIPSAGADTGSAPEVAADLGFLDALERGMAKR